MIRKKEKETGSKTYVTPEIKIIMLSATMQLCAGSGPSENRYSDDSGDIGFGRGEVGAEMGQ